MMLLKNLGFSVNSIPPIMPDPSVDPRLINNLRRARLDFEEVGLQLEEVIAKFDESLRRQRLERIKQKQ